MITESDKNVLYRKVGVDYGPKFVYWYEMYPATLITM